MAITVTNTGYIKRTAISTYRKQRRGGKGRIGMRTRDEDFVSHLFVASTHAYIMIFSDRGRAYWLKVHEIPDVGPGGKGKAIANLVSMEDGREDRRAAGGQGVRRTTEFIVMGTRKGVVKKTDAVGVQQPARRRHHRDGRRRRRRGDRRAGHRRQRARSSSAPATAWRSASRRPTSGRWAAPPTASAASRCATTTRSWRWRSCSQGGTLLTVTENGYGKRTEIDEYRVQSRGGVGIINIQTIDRNGQVVGIAYVHDDDELMIITQQGMILRMRADDVRVDRPRHAGRPADRHRRGRRGRLDREAGREGRRPDDDGDRARPNAGAGASSSVDMSVR